MSWEVTGTLIALSEAHCKADLEGEDESGEHHVHHLPRPLPAPRRLGSRIGVRDKESRLEPNCPDGEPWRAPTVTAPQEAAVDSADGVGREEGKGGG